MSSFKKSLPMQHIDRKSLYTNLESRIRYLHSFLDFGASDIEALVIGSKYIQALIPAVVNIVYKKLLNYDITARAFQTRSTAFEGPMDEVLDEDSPQILHRKYFLRAYLKKLCSDPTQMEFWEYLDKVGMMHTGIGRTYPLHIEYIHIGAGLAVIQDVLNEAILSHPRLQLPRKIAIVKALGKVIWIQNDLFTKWYVHDGEEFTDGMDYGEIEKEGWLHGKKVLDPERDGGAPSAAAPAAAPTAPAGVCPFSGSVMTDGEKAAAPSTGGVCPFSGSGADLEKLSIHDEDGKKDEGDDTKSDVTEKAQ
ncbi:Protoglobin-domain-containing protein [Cercophora scortea]|uniref:Protoglobin-domain-containing protein n=1 Tax=Cercophora scortea TaxID=314031 RepID=A0AAE0J3N9_9PEZI|nr:Protoglobin-domain-containing protein [Cercophora scortea]